MSQSLPKIGSSLKPNYISQVKLAHSLTFAVLRISKEIVLNVYTKDCDLYERKPYKSKYMGQTSLEQQIYP